MNVNIRLPGKGTNLVSVTTYTSDKVQDIVLSNIIPEDYDYICLRFLPTFDNSLLY